MQRSASFAPPARLPWARPRTALDRFRERTADPAQRPELLWRALWSPYTLWADAPAPERTRHTAPVPRELGLAGEAVVAGVDRIRRRLWATHALAAVCRGLWLGLLITSVLMLVDALGGPIFNPVLAAIAGAPLFLGGLILAALSKPSRARTARMLDRTFGLQERLGTAIDDLGLGIPQPGERAPVVYLQMADAANALAALRNDRRLRPALPVREIVLMVLAALVLATLAFLRGLGGGIPDLATAQVPPFTPAIERPAEPELSAAELDAATMAPTIEEVLERSDRSAQARRDLQALAAALADHAVTRPAAEQIARGDYAEAGDRLRDAASQAGDLSPGAREGLAGDLDRAAERMQPETNGLEEASRQAASGLREGDQQAESGMSELAEAVESAGQQVVPQGELAAQMRSAQQAQAQRGDSGAASSQSQSGDASGQYSESAAGGDPGSGADATSNADGSQSAQEGQQGSQPGDATEGQQGQGGEGGRANAPGAAEQPGEGAGGQPGEPGSESVIAGGQEGDMDSASARRGGGAGTGQGEESEVDLGAAGGNRPVAGGEDPADPNVSAGDGAEADVTALEGANERVALPGGSGDEGVQTASDGGSALRGSGAGVTAGSGFATQGAVDEAGPDSNRVPPQHRETVERYFSNGSGE